MAKHTPIAPSPADSSYHFQVGDLIEYRPGDGHAYPGRIVAPYQSCNVNDDAGNFIETRVGYAIEMDGIVFKNGLPAFAYPERLRLRADLAAARECNAFQMMLAGILSAPRRGRPPKSPYPSVRGQGAGEARHG